MVYLYLCKACEKGDHGNCELGYPAPKGHYGGSKCRCQCGGNPRWNTPEYIEEELKKLIQSIMDHQKASEEAMRKSPLQVNCPPKSVTQKVHLKKPEDGKA